MGTLLQLARSNEPNSQNTMACKTSGAAIYCTSDWAAWNMNSVAIPASTITSGLIPCIRAKK